MYIRIANVVIPLDFDPHTVWGSWEIIGGVIAFVVLFGLALRVFFPSRPPARPNPEWEAISAAYSNAETTTIPAIRDGSSQNEFAASQEA